MKNVPFSSKLLGLFFIVQTRNKCYITHYYAAMIHNILYFRGLDKKQAVLLTHGDSVEKVAENFKSIANSSTTIAGIANEKAHIYGLQFHPEVG